MGNELVVVFLQQRQRDRNRGRTTPLLMVVNLITWKGKWLIYGPTRGVGKSFRSTRKFITINKWAGSTSINGIGI